MSAGPITRDEILDRRDARLSEFSLFSPSIDSQFDLLAVDDDGSGGYAVGRVGNNLVRFDITGRVLSGQDGFRVKITAMQDSGDAKGTLTSTGESWTGHQVPAKALIAADKIASRDYVRSL